MNEKLQLAPSIICSDLTNLTDLIDNTELAGAAILHVDAMDNQFVSGLGFSPQHVRWIRSLTNYWIDVHLMVNPSAVIAREFCAAGANRIILHAEVDDIQAAVASVEEENCQIGFAIKPDTCLDVLLPFKDKISTLLAFTVNPGKRGQKIRSDALSRVSEVKAWIVKNQCQCSLQVDGGVYLDSICQLKMAGADIFVVGAAFFGKDGKGDSVTLASELRARLDLCSMEPV